jgi:lysophospholipase L1-like esterase
MKKLLLLLLLPYFAIAQVSNGREFEAEAIKTTGSQTITNPVYLVTEGVDGTHGKTTATALEKTSNKSTFQTGDGTGGQYLTKDATAGAFNELAESTLSTGAISNLSKVEMIATSTTNLKIRGTYAVEGVPDNYSPMYFASNLPADGSFIIPNFLKSFDSFNYPLSQLETPTGNNEVSGILVNTNKTYVKFLGLKFNGGIITGDTDFKGNKSVVSLGYIVVVRAAGVITFKFSPSSESVVNQVLIAGNTSLARDNTVLTTDVGVSFSTTTTAFNSITGNLYGMSINWHTNNNTVNPNNGNSINTKAVIGVTNQPFSAATPTSFNSTSPALLNTTFDGDVSSTEAVAIKTAYFNTTTQLTTAATGNVFLLYRLMITQGGRWFWQIESAPNNGALSTTITDAKTKALTYVWDDAILPKGVWIKMGTLVISRNYTNFNPANSNDFAWFPSGAGGGGSSAVQVIGDATETVKGVVELSTPAETTAGTDNTKAITPLSLASSTIGVNGVILKNNASAPSVVDGVQYKLTQPTTTGQTWSTTYNPVLSVANGFTDYVRNKPASFRKKLMVIGSSVAFGQGATANNGWANKLGVDLVARGWVFKNHAIPGNSTTAVINRFYTDVVPENPDVLIIALSLQNEGIMVSDKETVYNSFKSGLKKLALMCKQQGIIPVIASTYPSNDYTSVEYKYIQQINKELDSWGVIGINMLGALDNLAGNFVAGSFADGLHPNDVGHQEMYKSVPISLFDGLMSWDEKRLVPEKGAITIGVDNTTDRPIETIFDTNLSNYTVSFWLKVNDLTSTGNVLAGFGTGIARFSNSSGIGLRYINSSGTSVDFGVFPEVTKLWYHVAVTYNSITLKSRAYFNGNFIGELSDNVSLSKFVLGGRADSGQASLNVKNTDFKDLAIYRTRLTDLQIKELYSGNILKSGLEIFSSLGDKDINVGYRLLNFAPTSSYLKVNSSAFSSNNKGVINSDVVSSKVATDAIIYTTTPPTSASGYSFLSVNSANGSTEKISSASVALDATVLHRTGSLNETFNGIKSATNTGSTSINGIALSNDGQLGTQALSVINTSASTGRGALFVNNSASGSAIVLDNNSTSGIGLYFSNGSSGYGSYGENFSSGILNRYDSATSSTGDLIDFYKNNVLTTKFNHLGEITAPKFQTTGGTTAQFVDGTGALQLKSQFQTSLTNPVTSQATGALDSGAGFIPRLVNNTLIDDSNIYQDSSGKIGIGATDLSETFNLRSANPVINFEKAGILNWKVGNVAGNNFRIQCDNNAQTIELVPSGGTVLIGTTTDNGNDPLQVAGTISASPATLSNQVVVKSQLDAVKPYKVYTALLSQTGTSAPTATVLENTLGGTVVWTRNITGNYTGTLGGIFLSNKTYYSVITNMGGFGFISGLQSDGSNNVLLTTGLGTNPSDNVLSNTSIEIRVYN